MYDVRSGNVWNAESATVAGCRLAKVPHSTKLAHLLRGLVIERRSRVAPRAHDGSPSHGHPADRVVQGVGVARAGVSVRPLELRASRPGADLRPRSGEQLGRLGA